MGAGGAEPPSLKLLEALKASRVGNSKFPSQLEGGELSQWGTSGAEPRPQTSFWHFLSVTECF